MKGCEERVSPQRHAAEGDRGHVADCNYRKLFTFQMSTFIKYSEFQYNYRNMEKENDYFKLWLYFSF